MKYINTILAILLLSTITYSQQTSIAVIDLKNVGLEEHFSTLLTDALRAEMFKYEKFKVMNRENMQEIMGEQAFQASGVCDDNACYVEMGEVLGVEKIVTGSIGKLGNTYSLTIKMIDIETSENDKIITDRKKCSEDDLFIMIENSVKELAGLEKEKITEPTELKEIKEVNTSKISDGFTDNEKDIKAWEVAGMTRNEYIAELGRQKYKSEKQSAIDNGVKSFIFPGWGNLKRAWMYKTIELVGFGSLIFGVLSLSDDNVENAIGLAALGFAVMSINHIASPIDAVITTIQYNSDLREKYNISFTPTYNPRNNQVGIGFAVNF
ncbi:MAG: hypothetical protein KAH33_05450 [Candidatus Delongbacteria bacterium]|nr:hypothetical protein [Candidatus Delongbacteria bacterium]